MYNTETFIEKAKEKHGDFYDYSHVDYQGSRKKVEICLHFSTKFVL